MKNIILFLSVLMMVALGIGTYVYQKQDQITSNQLKVILVYIKRLWIITNLWFFNMRLQIKYQDRDQY